MNLTASEYGQLSAEDRAMLDQAIQQISPERNAEFTALMLSIRAIVRHDTAGIHNAVSGVFELQDIADQSSKELLETARSFREDVATLTAQMAALREQLESADQVSTADRADLRRRAERADGRILALALLIALLLLDLLYRYGLIVANSLFSLILVFAL